MGNGAGNSTSIDRITAKVELENDELVLIESLRSLIAELVPDSIKQIYSEVRGHRPNETQLAFYLPDDPESYDRAALRRAIAESPIGAQAIHNIYHVIEDRSARPDELRVHRESLASGSHTFWSLMNALCPRLAYRKAPE
jgi:hypothetical protein